MRKIGIIFCSVLFAIGVAACGGSSGSKTTSTLSPAQEQQAQAIVQGCLPKGNLLTKTGRAAIESCIAPKGNSQKLQNCVEAGHLPHSISSLEAKLTTCAEQNR